MNVHQLADILMSNADSMTSIKQEAPVRPLVNGSLCATSTSASKQVGVAANDEQLPLKSNLKQESGSMHVHASVGANALKSSLKQDGQGDAPSPKKTKLPLLPAAVVVSESRAAATSAAVLSALLEDPAIDYIDDLVEKEDDDDDEAFVMEEQDEYLEYEALEPARNHFSRSLPRKRLSGGSAEKRKGKHRKPVVAVKSGEGKRRRGELFECKHGCGYTYLRKSGTKNDRTARDAFDYHETQGCQLLPRLLCPLGCNRRGRPVSFGGIKALRNHYKSKGHLEAMRQQGVSEMEKLSSLQPPPASVPQIQPILKSKRNNKSKHSKKRKFKLEEAAPLGVAGDPPEVQVDPKKPRKHRTEEEKEAKRKRRQEKKERRAKRAKARMKRKLERKIRKTNVPQFAPGDNNTALHSELASASATSVGGASDCGGPSGCGEDEEAVASSSPTESSAAVDDHVRNSAGFKDLFEHMYECATSLEEPQCSAGDVHEAEEAPQAQGEQLVQFSGQAPGSSALPAVHQ